MNTTKTTGVLRTLLEISNQFEANKLGINLDKIKPSTVYPSYTGVSFVFSDHATQ